MRDECYQFLKNEVGKVDIVGFGSYGEVKLARNTQNGEVVAIKMIYNKNAKEEIDVHHKLNHPNIIKLINYYYEKEKNVTYMVLEYASGGSLNEKIKFGYGQLNKQLAQSYFRDICEAVRYLHANNFMHRDIKPENILITDDNHAKLCDFGFASILEYRSTLCGTFEYMAPEMIQKKPYDYRIDIWALGILLFELIQGFAPFRGETGEEVIAEMKKPLVFSNRFDQVQIDLVKKILRVNSENRPDIAKILEHPYFKDTQSVETAKEIKEVREVKETKEGREEEQGNKLKENKSFKYIKDVKEELPVKEFKNIKIDNPEAKKKEGERRFDFFHRKAELKKQEAVEKVQKKEVNNQPLKESFKEPRKQPHKDLLKESYKDPLKQLHKQPLRDAHKQPFKELHKQPIKDVHKQLYKQLKKNVFKEQTKKEQTKIEFPREQPKRQQIKKEEGKWQFKPYVPPNLNNPPRNIMKSPNLKPMPNSFIPVSPSGFPQHTHQFNSSMQLPPTYQQGSFPQYPSNPNASMNINPQKYPPTSPVSMPPPAFVGANFIKPGHGQIGEQRNPNHQSFNANNIGNVPMQVPATMQFPVGLSWKKG